MLLESSGLKRLFSNTAGLITRNCWHWIPAEGSRPTADDPSKWNPHSCTSSSHTLSICQWFPILILQQSLLSLEYLCKKPPNVKKKDSPNGQLYFLFRNLLRLRTTSYLDSRHDGYFIVTSAITIFHSSIPFGNPISHSQTAAVYARGSSTGCNNFRFRCTSNLYDILFLVWWVFSFFLLHHIFWDSI